MQEKPYKPDLKLGNVGSVTKRSPLQTQIELNTLLDLSD